MGNLHLGVSLHKIELPQSLKPVKLEKFSAAEPSSNKQSLCWWTQPGVVEHERGCWVPSRKVTLPLSKIISVAGKKF